MTPYQTAADRIRSSATIDELDAVDEAITRVYEAGGLTVNEVARLDSLIVDKLIELEEQS